MHPQLPCLLDICAISETFHARFFFQPGQPPAQMLPAV
jgi:hypothetical protein